MQLEAEAGENRMDETLLADFRRAAVHDLSLFAVLHDAEMSATVIDSLRSSGFPTNLGLQLASGVGRDTLTLLDKALAGLPDVLDQVALDWLAVDYADIYLTHGLRASPCESVWLDDEQLERQGPMFQVRAWYRRHGLGTADWRKRPDDHLVLQLQFLAHLFGQNKCADPLSEAAQFMDEHLLRWLPDFAQRVAKRCATPFYAALALLTMAYCEELRELLAQILAQPRPTPEQVQTRMRPKRNAVVQLPSKYMPGMGPSW